MPNFTDSQEFFLAAGASIAAGWYGPDYGVIVTAVAAAYPENDISGSIATGPLEVSVGDIIDAPKGGYPAALLYIYRWVVTNQSTEGCMVTLIYFILSQDSLTI